MKEIRLSEWIGEGFYDIHRDIREGRHTHYWLKGGRGSGKSSFLSLEILLGLDCRQGRKRSGAAKGGGEFAGQRIRADELGHSCFGCGGGMGEKNQPDGVDPKGTGQKILFRGCDDPKKRNPSNFREGTRNFIWYEEADEFGGMAELRSLNQSLLRGGEEFRIFYSYNPPKQGRAG